eukprot:gene2781-4189_t
MRNSVQEEQPLRKKFKQTDFLPPKSIDMKHVMLEELKLQVANICSLTAHCEETAFYLSNLQSELLNETDNMYENFKNYLESQSLEIPDSFTDYNSEKRITTRTIGNQTQIIQKKDAKNSQFCMN